MGERMIRDYRKINKLEAEITILAKRKVELEYEEKLFVKDHENNLKKHNVLRLRALDLYNEACDKRDAEIRSQLI